MNFGIPEIIGVASATGLGVLGLIKSGLLKVSIGKNGNGNNKSSKDLFSPDDCNKKHDKLDSNRTERWKKLDETIAGWDRINQTLVLENQARKIENQNQAAQLREGTDKFEKIQDQVHKLDKGITLLLDRTGGVPKNWEDK